MKKRNHNPFDNEEDCIRRRMVINGDHYYIIQGKYKVQVTIPRENTKEREKERDSIDIICQEVLNISNKYWSKK